MLKVMPVYGVRNVTKGWWMEDPESDADFSTSNYAYAFEVAKSFAQCSPDYFVVQAV
jgi:hypothetical protein